MHIRVSYIGQQRSLPVTETIDKYSMKTIFDRLSRISGYSLDGRCTCAEAVATTSRVVAESEGATTCGGRGCAGISFRRGGGGRERCFVHKFAHLRGLPRRLKTQSAGSVQLLIFSSISIFLLASLVRGRRPSVLLVQTSRESIPLDLSTGISNLLQPAQTEVVLGQHSMYLVSWGNTLLALGTKNSFLHIGNCRMQHAENMHNRKK
jgi:hypothetical protein